VDDVVLVEPAEHFFSKAMEHCPNWEGISDLTKSVTFVHMPLQSFDASQPVSLESHRMGLGADPSAPEVGYDVVWCQWCLGHLTDPDLVKFLKQAKVALREPVDPEYPRGAGVIVVKENTIEDGPNGEPVSVYAEDDSSVTRYIKVCYIQFPFNSALGPMLRGNQYSRRQVCCSSKRRCRRAFQRAYWR
jgi:protein N-terminal methyltransferase